MVIASLFIPKVLLVLILNIFLGSSVILVCSHLFHSVARSEVRDAGRRCTRQSSWHVSVLHGAAAPRLEIPLGLDQTTIPGGRYLRLRLIDDPPRCLRPDRGRVRRALRAR